MIDNLHSRLRDKHAIFFWLIAILLFIPVALNELVFRLFDFRYGIDYWEHTGVFAEWLKNIWTPGMPHVSSDLEGQSARFMPFYFLLVSIASLLNLTPMQIMVLASIGSVLVTIIGVKLFFRSYFRNDWAPAVGLIVLFCCWGLGWLWSNLYQLRSFIYVSGYPSSFTFGLSLIGLWVIINYLRCLNNSHYHLFLVFSLTFLLFTCHPLTGAFAIVAMGLLALTEPNVLLKSRLKLVAALVLGALATEIWPYYSAIQIALDMTVKNSTVWIATVPVVTEQLSRFESLTSNHAFYKWAKFYNWQQVLATLGPALIGIPICIWMAIKRQHAFIYMGFALMMIPYISNLFFKVPLGHRFLLFAIIFLHLAIVWFILQVCGKESEANVKSITYHIRTLPIYATSVFLAGLLAINLGLVALEFYGLHFSADLSKRYYQNDIPRVSEQFPPLSQAISSDAVIIAPKVLSWPMSTFVAKTVALHHPNPYVKDYIARNRATRKFFSEDTGLADRLKILARYQVTHVALLIDSDEKHSSVKNELDNLGYKKIYIGDWVVYALQGRR